MIGLHCHFSPGLDAGAQSMAETPGLARAAVEDGILRVVLTPHINEGRYDNSFASLAALVDAFPVVLNKHKFPLQPGLAAEVRIGSRCRVNYAHDG